ncbi:phosphoribosylglycinamide formyltransferase [Arcticibacterium luteifluviistationis]|uniref:Phosphoribosylglycinamide formyltransferase n=1 Tax=Arcticibacterium luteifluviistationis TaxID=1784714 RepID=A0A2Z4GIC6_9BACT|nr:phosphoribosylglycinamide formyltransferase [Arcticibacterium luteifluviistationis]AWW00888.1 phosphoribosylglycinamide formyltransferase [Arcticibacterium luteifluviistationis]
MTKKIAIFASGGGSNAEAIVDYFKNNEEVEISYFLTNKADAGVIKRGRKLNIPTLVFSRKNFVETEQVVDFLKSQNIDLVVLAGFLWLIPSSLIQAFPNKIVNIHPALLPKHGGKGMWGHHVHEAVVANKEKESGITIHYVNENYDEGETIFQATCAVSPEDNPEQVATNVLKLEHYHFPRIIEKVLKAI